MSDRVADRDLPTLEQRMDDVRAVMDAAKSERAAIVGQSEGGGMAMLFAATYPERTTALITIGAYSRRIWDPGYPWAPTPEERQQFFDWIEGNWGGDVDPGTLAPSLASDEAFKQALARYFRLSASPGSALALAKMNTQIDVRQVLPTIRVPTLVLHRTGDLDANIAEGRYIAEAGPGEVLASSTVKDLVSGSGIVFEDRGAHTLKGIPRRMARVQGRKRLTSGILTTIAEIVMRPPPHWPWVVCADGGLGRRSSKGPRGASHWRQPRSSPAARSLTQALHREGTRRGSPPRR